MMPPPIAPRANVTRIPQRPDDESGKYWGQRWMDDIPSDVPDPQLPPSDPWYRQQTVPQPFGPGDLPGYRTAPGQAQPVADRDNPEDMFSEEQNLARNQPFARPGPYITKLSPQDELGYREWVMHMGISPEDAFGPNSAYDMRGFYQAMRRGDPRAQTSINQFDRRRHFPDIWKTPYDATFSNQSMYALPHAPQWRGNQYILPNGHVIFDDEAGRWYGMPQ